MGLGTSIRAQVNALINNSAYRSTLTLNPKTITISTDGGYSANTITSGTSRSVFCIPYNYFQSRTSFESEGDLTIGEVRVIIKASETIDLNDTITFNSLNWDIREIKPIMFNDVVVAQIVQLSRQIT